MYNRTMRMYGSMYRECVIEHAALTLYDVWHGAAIAARYMHQYACVCRDATTRQRSTLMWGDRAASARGAMEVAIRNVWISVYGVHTPLRHSDLIALADRTLINGTGTGIIAALATVHAQYDPAPARVAALPAPVATASTGKRGRPSDPDSPTRVAAREREARVAARIASGLSGRGRLPKGAALPAPVAVASTPDMVIDSGAAFSPILGV